MAEPYCPEDALCSHAHSHQAHSHHVHGPTQGPWLWISLTVTCMFVVGEAGAGYLSHSLALLSDAGHNFSDAFALALAAYAVGAARRPANARKTFGYHRVAILTALFNAATLMMIALLILYQAYQLFRSPQPVNGTLMLWVAALSVLMNTVIAALLHSGAKDSLNMRAAFVHMTGDALSATAVLVAGWVMKQTGWMYADPLVSVLIALFILWSSWGIVGEATDILLEGTPKGLDVNEMVAAMRCLEHVEAVHDLHIWTVSDGLNFLSCHVEVADTRTMAECSVIVQDINALLAKDYGIAHATIQTETAGVCVSASEETPLYCGEAAPTTGGQKVRGGELD